MFYFCHSFLSSFQVLQPQAHKGETVRRVLSELTQQTCSCLMPRWPRWAGSKSHPAQPAIHERLPAAAWEQKDHSQSVLQTSSKSTFMAEDCIWSTGFKSPQKNHWRDFSLPPQNILAVESDSILQGRYRASLWGKKERMPIISHPGGICFQYFCYSMASIVIGFVKTYKQPWNIASNSTMLACHK